MSDRLDTGSAQENQHAPAAVLAIPTVTGKRDILETLPEVLDCADVMYLPYRRQGPWGIYDMDGHAVEGTSDFRGPKREPMHQSRPMAVTPEPAEAICDESDLIYVGEIFPHFGHFMINTLSRFWDLRNRPSARLLFHSELSTVRLFQLPHVAQVFQAIGLREEQFVQLEVPTRLHGLIVPQPSFEIQHFAHRVYLELTREIGARLTQDAGLTDERPLYLSKTQLGSGVRHIVNEQEIEDELARHGVRIVHPETLSLPQQVDILGQHQTLVGPVGSAFHLTAFLPEGRRIVGLNYNEWLNGNFELFDKLCGNKASYYYTPAVEKVEDPTFMSAFRIEDPVAVARALLEQI